MWRGIRLTDGVVELRRPDGPTPPSSTPRSGRRSPSSCRGWPGPTRTTPRWSRRVGPPAARAFADGAGVPVRRPGGRDGEVLGTIGLNAIDRLNRWANLGYWVRTDRVGQGYVTRGAALVAGFGFGELGLGRIEVLAAVGNRRARPWRERLGRPPRGRAAAAVARRRRRPGRRGVLADPVTRPTARRAAQGPVNWKPRLGTLADGRRAVAAVAGELEAADHVPVHLVGPVGEAHRALRGVQARERRPVGDAGGAVDLDRLVDDGADPLGHERLHRADPDPGLGVAHRVHRLGGAQHHEPHRLDLDAGPCDHLGVLARGARAACRTPRG